MAKVINEKKDFVCVIEGEDDFLVDSACGKSIDSLLTPDQKQIGLFTADPDRIDIADLLDELRTLPFLAPRRVVLIKNAEKFISVHRPILEKYFDSPSPSGTLVLTVKKWLKTTKLAKKLPAIGQLITINKMKPYQVPDWIISYARSAQNKSISKQAAQMLIDYIGPDTALLAREIDKLADFVDQNKNITEKNINDLTSKSKSFNAFEVIDAMTDSRLDLAVKRLRNMFENDKSAEFTAVGAFAFQLRRMFDAKAMLDKKIPPQQIQDKLRIWYNTQTFFKKIRKLSLLEIAALIEELASIDFEIKTGRAEPKIAIERFVMKFAAR